MQLIKEYNGWKILFLGNKKIRVSPTLARFIEMSLNRSWYVYFECLYDGKEMRSGKGSKVVIVPANSELYNPQDYSLIVKDSEYAMYIANHNDDIFLKYNNGYAWIRQFYDSHILPYHITAFFDAEKPFDLETLNFIKELERKRSLSRSINFGGLDVYILEGVNVRNGIIENAEIVKFEDKKIRCLIATNGNKIYTEEMIKAIVKWTTVKPVYQPAVLKSIL